MVHSAHIHLYWYTVFIPPVMIHQITHYSQDIHYSIPSDWLVHNSPLLYMDHYGWLKSMSHLSSMCFSSPLNPQVPLYDGRDIHFDENSLNIICSHHIQSLILKSGVSVQYHPNYNGPNLKLKNMYGNAIMNWMRNHGNPKFTLVHINDVIVETWGSFKISSISITQDSFNKTHVLSHSPPDQYMNPQSYLAANQTLKGCKADGI